MRSDLTEFRAWSPCRRVRRVPVAFVTPDGIDAAEWTSICLGERRGR
jgi:hypothetical protein